MAQGRQARGAGRLRGQEAQRHGADDVSELHHPLRAHLRAANINRVGASAAPRFLFGGSVNFTLRHQ